ncbi:hypothetical protein, partial [Holdemanella biformis]|uniref:hypothetical protein n=1 Tax=Holdemanella biformis TaxID=1735 RepID=UPI001C390A92
VPYKINLLGFTKSPNNDLLIYFNTKYKWFVERKYIVFNFHTKKFVTPSYYQFVNVILSLTVLVPTHCMSFVKEVVSLRKMRSFH